MVNLLLTKNNTILDMLVNNWIDQWVWTALWLSYLPYRLPDIMSDTDKWAQQVSTNGARWSNLCKPHGA